MSDATPIFTCAVFLLFIVHLYFTRCVYTKLQNVHSHDVFDKKAIVQAFITCVYIALQLYIFSENLSDFHMPQLQNISECNMHPVSPKGGGYSEFEFNFNPEEWKLVDYVPNEEACKLQTAKTVLAVLHPNALTDLATHNLMARIAKIHGITWKRNIVKSQFPMLFKDHMCPKCRSYTSVLSPRRKAKAKPRTVPSNSTPSSQSTANFPPNPPTESLMESIIENFCKENAPFNIVEEGCAVCAQLTPVKNLTDLRSSSVNLDLLKCTGITRKERLTSKTASEELSGPVVAPNCTKICDTCKVSLQKNKLPRFALANGLWIGQIPTQLQNLTLIEKLMIARVRHNACYATVASGGRKLKCNVVAFECNLPKIYNLLPPPIDDLNSMIAVIFSGPTEPNESDLKRTPFAVRRRKVAEALDWLTLNHPDYQDVSISQINLQQYPEHGIPVDIVKYQRTSNRDAENIAVYDNEEEEGTVSGKCATVIHGLIDSPESKLTASQLKAKAIAHWNQGGAAIRMGRSKDPVASFGNPSWWSQMFPWLFPYGLGTIGLTSLSPKIHKRYLLMYYDKRFQLDELFSLVAFNHEQLQCASDAGFLTVEKTEFSNMCDRLLSVKEETLADLADRMAKGENVACKKDKTDDEARCFQILKDLDHINGKVPGSLTSKKWMRNEIWSMVNYHGAPLWYITLNPADKKHPICLYWCSKDLEYQPCIDISDDDRRRLIADNPAAGARFFNFMINNFLKHVLGMDNHREGYFGKTKAYYGTVEQQGRLSLHLHMLIWIEGALTPEETRRRIMDPTSEFRKNLVTYLESHHQGSFMDSDLEKVRSAVNEARAREDYKDPTTTLPEPPKRKCSTKCGTCAQCCANKSWWLRFKTTVNDLLLKSNVHTCRSSLKHDGTRKKNSDAPGCLDNIWKKCKARMPRCVHLFSSVDDATGTITLKHLEAQMNTFVPLITYLFRSNTDTTSLRSGTAIKAVLLYISNYITKVSLKTHAVFDAIRSIFRRNQEFLRETRPKAEKCRILMTKFVNSMTAKMEIGAPMAAMYLLNHPDHYTDCRFQPFYWINYVQEVNQSWNYPLPSSKPERVPIVKKGKKISGVSHVEDYCKRSPDLETVCLYDWIGYSKRTKTANLIDKDDVIEYCEDDEGEDGEDVVPVAKIPKKNLFSFLPTHPLVKTYKTHFNSKGAFRIPTFLGPALPRSDIGDREYYCMTMLTLFKPWRSGKDLKTDGDSWDATFSTHAFTPKQREILTNFNIQYECKDASDDYFTQLKKGTNSDLPVGFVESSSEDPNMSTWVQDTTNSEPNEDVDKDQIDIDILTEVIGKSQLKRDTKFAFMKSLLTRLHLNVARPELVEETVKNPVQIEKPLTPQQWERLIADEKNAIQEERKNSVPEDKGFPKLRNDNNVNATDIITKDYLKKTYCSQKWHESVEKIRKDFSLNEEQERAFKIVVNHACSSNPEQLRMYIAGMGGTGKSQVLKALKKFFETRKEKYRFISVAPTGSAAALLDGNTYHSAFGVNDQWETSEKSFSVLREKLKGLQYIFFDEVSMLSCRDLYKISRQLAKITGEHENPFGNINMIFAGDFAQLPPAVGGQDASLFSRAIGWIADSLRSQESAIGKAIWHQVDTVVILTKNMRQRKQSTEDAKFRTALENMRYGRCTPEDVAFLRTRVSGEHPNPSITDPDFRNVSVITAYHVDKDAFNEIGCQRWAEEHGQKLQTFVSEDETATERSERLGKQKTKQQETSIKMTPERRKQLWDQPSSSNSAKIPGSLKVCIGMPVIIHHNFATELCITRGQEARVVGWIDKETHLGRRALAVLFVELLNPPHNVKIDGLPTNVVPIPQTTIVTKAFLKDDSVMRIYRSQVDVALNFAMTDFSAQGKTRPKNPTHLTNLTSHFAYYTALSRSATAAGTLILQGFNPMIVTQGISGALRQEFRELELLNEITSLRYEGVLPLTFDITRTRNNLIDLYRQFKGNSYLPKQLHPSLAWSPKDPFFSPTNTNVSWNDKPDAKEEGSFVQGEKRPAADSQDTEAPAKKRRQDETRDDIDYKKMLEEELARQHHKAATTQQKQSNEQDPVGSQWNNNSCAYDSVLTILYNGWQSDFLNINVDQLSISDELKHLFQDFGRIRNGENTINGVRDKLRDHLVSLEPHKFKQGCFASVSDIFEAISQLDYPVTSTLLRCTNSRCMSTAANDRLHYVHSAHLLLYPYRATTIQQFFNGRSTIRSSECPQCKSSMASTFSLVNHPSVLCIDLTERKPAINIAVTTTNETTTSIYSLRGVVYHKANHFTARIVNGLQEVWHYDGLNVVVPMTYEGEIKTISLKQIKGAKPVAALYFKRL